jgi:hypothetical protein
MMYTFLIFFYSCDQTRETIVYVSRIDSLLVSLNESALGFESIDTAIVSQYFQQTENMLDSLNQKNNIHDHLAVNKYNNIRNSFGNFINTYLTLVNELNYTRSQLADLKFDAEKNNLSFARVSLYFEQEKQSVHVLKLKLDFYQKQINTASVLYINTITEIENLPDSLPQ